MGNLDQTKGNKRSKQAIPLPKVSDLPIMAGHFLYENMSPYEQQFYKPCDMPHGVSCQVFIKKHKSDKWDFGIGDYGTVVDEIMPHYWLNYDERTHRPTPYKPDLPPPGFNPVGYTKVTDMRLKDVKPSNGYRKAQ